MSKLIIDRDFMSLPLTGMQFGVFLSAMDLGTIYRDQIVLCDKSIYFNMMDKLPTQRQREDVREAMEFLIEEGHVVAEEIGHGFYIVDCQRSFHNELSQLPHGGKLLMYEDLKKIMQSGQSWQGALRYYLMLAEHMKKDNMCSFSRQYFAGKLDMNELTLTKYNNKLKDLGVISIARRKDMPSYYYLNQST